MTALFTTRLAAAAVLALGALPPLPALAGDVQPPPGPVEPTMKTLDDIEPGILINDLPGDADSVHKIEIPGRYIVGDTIIVPPGKSGIEIAINPALTGEQRVTIDLSGFDIVGSAGAESALKYYVTSVGHTYAHRVTDRFGNATLSDFDGDGISIDGVTELSIDNIRITRCGGAAVSAVGHGAGNREVKRMGGKISLCRLAGGGGGAGGLAGAAVALDGFDAVAIDGLDISDCTGDGVYEKGRDVREMTDSIENVRVSNCGGSGVVIDMSGSAGGRVMLRGRAVVQGSGSHGLHIVGSSLSPPDTVTVVVIDDLVSSSNGGDGARVEFDGSGAASVRLRASTLNGNGGNGTTLTGAAGYPFDPDIRELVATANIGSGLHVSGSLTVSGSTFSDNGSHGIDWTAQDDNRVGVQINNSGCWSNGGDGARFTWTQTSGPFKFSTREGEFSHNTGTGLNLDLSDFPRPGLTMLGDCSASGNGSQGFKIGNDPPVISSIAVHARACTASDNALDGFAIEGAGITVEACDSFGNAGSGFVLDGTRSQDDGVVKTFQCSADQNTGDGFLLTAQECLVESSSATGNDGDGLDLRKGVTKSKAFFKWVFAAANGQRGMAALEMDVQCSDSSATDNGLDGLSCVLGGSVSMTGGDFSSNLGSGAAIDVSGTLTIEGASMCSNTGGGAVVFNSSGLGALAADLSRCRLMGNTGAGLSLSGVASGRIAECSAFSNGGVGIECLAFSHILTNNTAGHNGPGGVANYSVLLPGNAVGPVVTETTISTTDNATNYSP